MISETDNCLFVHIPKVAGQSVEAVFLARAGLDWGQRERFLLKPNTDPALGPPRLAHLTASEYIELGYLSETEFASMFSFAFVRNPWDRLVSEYLYRKYPYSFETFLLKHFPKAEDDDYTLGRDLYRHVIPQAKFLYNNEGELLVDFIGKFESLEEDFATVSEKITGERLTLPHKNKSGVSGLKKILGRSKQKKVHYSQYYTSKTQALVAELYRDDIRLFNYKFECL